MEEKKELFMAIEYKRKELHIIVDRFGILSKEALKYSKELDILIMKHIKPKQKPLLFYRKTQKKIQLLSSFSVLFPSINPLNSSLVIFDSIASFTNSINSLGRNRSLFTFVVTVSSPI